MNEKPEDLRLADDLRARIAYRPSRDSTQTLLTCDDAARCLEEQHAKIEELLGLLQEIYDWTIYKNTTWALKVKAALAAGWRHITDRNWQSMSTAPKDGSHILVWTELDEIEVAFWMDGKKHGDLEGYWAYPSQDHFGMQALLWQPLPDRPAKAQVRREELVRDRLRDMERKQRRRR